MDYYPLKSYCNTDVRIAGTSTQNTLLILQVGYLIKQRDNYKYAFYCSMKFIPILTGCLIILLQSIAVDSNTITAQDATIIISPLKERYLLKCIIIVVIIFLH